MRQILTRKEPPPPPPPDTPFAPLAKRQGEAYAQATQYVADLQQEVELLKTRNEELTAKVSLLEGANDRLHDENERILKQAQKRHDDTQNTVYDVHRTNAALLAVVNSAASVLIEGVKQATAQQENTDQLIAAVERGITGESPQG